VIVQHQSDTGQVVDLIKDIVRSLIEKGVPPNFFLNEEDGRGKEDEIIEDLPQDIKKEIKDVIADYQWSNLLADILTSDVEEFAF
jgi:hypothetical protein